MLLGLLGLLTPASFAFAPTNDVWIGIEPSRLMHVHGPRQARLREQAAWRAFTDGDGYGWQARFDERTGTAFRAWGPGIDLGALASSKDVEGALRSFFANNPDIVGVELDQLRLKSANYVPRTNTWYVDFDRLVGGAPIWRGGVTARIKFGKLVLLGVETHPGLNGVEPATLGATDAIRIAALDGPAALAPHTDESAKLVVLPEEVDGALRYRLTWEVRSRTASPPGRWVSHVDARTGELVNVYNEVRFLDGTLYATHDTRTVNGSYSTSPAPLAYLTGASSGSTVTTDTAGAFTIDPSESWTTQLRGSYVTVRNDAGAEASLSFTGASPTWTTSDADQAEIDTYIFLHHVREWGLQFAPEVPQVTDPLRSNVNLDSNCNAYWDGDVNFYQAGGGCNNTARIADVNYHEWGHGFHYYSLEAGEFDGPISEGIGDVTSALQTLDPEVAPYFGTSGSYIREIETDYVYPDDVTGAVHQDGLIYAGAIWDLYLALSDSYGEAVGVKGEAWRVTSRLFADGIKGGPTIPESYDEVIVADDDNGDLSDGTPHQCEIIDAFGKHGLGPGGGVGSLLSVEHDALVNQPANVAIPVAGEIVNTSPTCVDFTIDSVDVVYSTDRGATWDDAPLGVAGDAFDGDLPGIAAGTVVEYYLRITADDGSEVMQPSGGEIAPYTFFVGELEEIYCEPFDDDGDYTHDLLDGEDQRGADDWAFGAPGGYSSDPSEAFTGRSVWGNDLGGGQYNGDYQPGIVNRLTSAEIDVEGASQLVVQYRRWLNVEDGVYDRARVYVGDDVAWENYETNSREGDAHTEDTEWILHTLLVDTDGSPITLGWEIESDDGLEFGGWNLDDVCVYRIGDSPEPAALVIDDFLATDDLSERVEVSWTQPDDATATDAVVVRRADRFPESKDDGDVVWSGAATPGQILTATDAGAGGYYAVFAGGDAGWMTGAVEGANADVGAAVDENGDGLYDGAPVDDTVVLSGDCGCDTGSGSTGVLVAAAAGALALARRRRSA